MIPRPVTHRDPARPRRCAAAVTAGLLGAIVASPGVQAQTFDSGSDGSDGVLVLDTPGNITFDPRSFDPPLDEDGDGIYHFETITIGAEVTVRLGAEKLGSRPVIWLAKGDVRIDGTLDLRGEDGPHTAAPVPARAGAGGGAGGTARRLGLGATPGQGPGGASVLAGGGSARGAGHVTHGTNCNVSGAPYGNRYLLPLLGGSGGAGSDGPVQGIGSTGGAGGAGGGAILVASSSRISLDGIIDADGGHAAVDQSQWGGGGSGGAIRLMAPTIEGQGALSARGGRMRYADGVITDNCNGSGGRIRIEAFNYGFLGTTESAMVLLVTPGLVFPPASAPRIRVVSVDGIPLPPLPTGSFAPADARIESNEEVVFVIAAENVPVGTVVNLRLISETEGLKTFDSMPLEGTFESSTATATTTVPHGFSRFTLEASY